MRAAVQALAGILLPSATVFLLLLCNDKAVLGPWVNRPWLNVVATFIVSVLFVLSLILMTTTVFPCPKCGAVVRLREGETRVQCTGCGSTVAANAQASAADLANARLGLQG